MSNQSPSSKLCAGCGNLFTVTAGDQAFYERVSPTFLGLRHDIPSPSHCPSCRVQRRLTWRNERTLYRRACSLTGTPVLSTYSPDSPFTVYCPSAWYSDAWNAFDYGREFDFSRPFFDQFDDLLQAVPALSINLQVGNENCDYTNLVSYNRNCYFIFAGNENEDCFYSTYLQNNKNSSDCFFLFRSERCYECIDCYECYNLRYSQYCFTCSDSHYLSNCRGCSYCFGCVGLANQSYCLFNQPLPAEEYHQKLAILTVQADSASYIAKHLAKLKSSVYYKAYQGFHNEEVSGDHLFNCRRSYDCYDCTALEDCRFCTWLHKSSDCYDCYAWGNSGELGYENHICGLNFYQVRFCDSCWNGVRDLLYCRLCVNNAHDLFGCIGIRQKQFCILNKSYTAHEYEDLAMRIIAHMRETGEWGEFFPTRISPYGYNETVADEYEPLHKTEVRNRGWPWQDSLPFTIGRETLQPSQIPLDIDGVSPSIVNEILRCQQCARNYRITSQELKLYRSLHVPIPRCCFDCRYQLRRSQRNPRRLWNRRCAQCDRIVPSTYAPERREKIVCDKCFPTAEDRADQR